MDRALVKVVFTLSTAFISHLKKIHIPISKSYYLISGVFLGLDSVFKSSKTT